MAPSTLEKAFLENCSTEEQTFLKGLKSRARFYNRDLIRRLKRFQRGGESRLRRFELESLEIKVKAWLDNRTEDVFQLVLAYWTDMEDAEERYNIHHRVIVVFGIDLFVNQERHEILKRRNHVRMVRVRAPSL